MVVRGGDDDDRWWSYVVVIGGGDDDTELLNRRMQNNETRIPSPPYNYNLPIQPYYIKTDDCVIPTNIPLYITLMRSRRRQKGNS